MHSFELILASLSPKHDISMLSSYLRQRELLTEYSGKLPGYYMTHIHGFVPYLALKFVAEYELFYLVAMFTTWK
jgi:hypothetical protein